MDEEENKNVEAPIVNTISLQFAINDIENILELLSWTQNTASYLATLEKDRGTEIATAKLNTYATAANQLIQYITKSIKTGEPDFNQRN